jgi:hypothetical protein
MEANMAVLLFMQADIIEDELYNTFQELRRPKPSAVSVTAKHAYYVVRHGDPQLQQ